MDDDASDTAQQPPQPQDHFEQKHTGRESGTPMPGQLAEDIALRYHEKEATAQLLDHYPKGVKVKCGPQCACKSTPFVM